MKKYAVCVMITAFVLVGVMFLFVSCSEDKIDAEEILAYQSKTSYNGIAFCVGKSEYNINIALGALTGEHFVRDADILFDKGTLDGMVFTVRDGELRLKASDFEMELSEKDSPSLYALVSAFSIEPSDFVGVTKSTEYDGMLSARFNGRYNYELTLKEIGSTPEIIKIKSEDDTYTVKFKTAETKEDGDNI